MEGISPYRVGLLAAGPSTASAVVALFTAVIGYGDDAEGRESPEGHRQAGGVATVESFHDCMSAAAMPLCMLVRTIHPEHGAEQPEGTVQHSVRDRGDAKEEARHMDARDSPLLHPTGETLHTSTHAYSRRRVIVALSYAGGAHVDHVCACQLE